MASYNYPKVNEAMNVNLNSPPPQEYQTSQFQMNSPQKSPNFQARSPEKSSKKYENKLDSLASKTRKKIVSCFTYKYWQPYFNISTKDFGKRILAALFPCTNESFFTLIKENPDLYGPFWIYATLVFCLATSGNLFAYFLYPSNAYFTYNFSYIPSAFLIVYIYGFGAPFLMNMILKIFEMEHNAGKTYMESLCIFGYSIFAFIPMSFLCMIPSYAIQWLFMGIATLDSTAFLVYNYWRELKVIRNNNKWVILGLLIVGQVTLYILFELFFYSSFVLVTVVSSSTSSSDSSTSSDSSSSSTSSSSDSTSTTATTALLQRSFIFQKLISTYQCSYN